MSERHIDQALVEQSLAGDKEAFDILVMKYQPKIVQAITAYTRDPNEAWDITQDTFIRAYKALGQFRGDCMFYTWVYRIAINTAKNHMKALNRRPPSTDIDISDGENSLHAPLLHEYETPEYLLLCDEIEGAICQALETLPNNLRASLVLREMAGLSYDEIAERLDCPIGTVRSRIFRARSCVDEQLKPYLDQE